MTTDRRTDHATRAALMRLRLADYRISTLIAFRRDIEGGADAAAELSWAIDGVVKLLRGDGGPAPAQAPASDSARADHWDMIVRRLEERHRHFMEDI